jgi:toxin ParE1/3/4
MSFEVRLSETAIEDLIALRRSIAGEADAVVADTYIDRLATKVSALKQFPERGTLRVDIGPDIRSLSFERRRIIFYRVIGNIVSIERIIEASRDFSDIL